jgi:hypothetical protein
LYRRDANNGQLSNWDLNDNPKTARYAATLRALDAVAPASLRRDVDPILAYYTGAASPPRSWASYIAILKSGARVLAYVNETCGIDTSDTPEDSSTSAP